MATPKYDKTRGMWILQQTMNGKRKVFYSAVPGLKGKREVIAKCDDWIESGGVDKITVAKCVELYLKDIEARLGKRDSYSKAEKYSRLYILPALGNRKINDLTLRDWQEIINTAKPIKDNSKELSYKTLTHLRTIITGLHKFAYNNYYCDDWRGSLYIPQGHQKGEREILQPDDIKSLFEDSDDWFIDAFRVMLLCGLRPGECYGLTLDSIGDGVLYIKRSINDEGEITEGKNKNARRVVPMPTLASELIQRTIERNKQANLHTNWIFCNQIGAPTTQDNARKHWNRLKKEKNLPGTPYCLRHTFVSIVSSQTHLAEGTIKGIVGHSKVMDTFGTYKHTVSNELEKAADVINLTFERIKNPDIAATI